MLFGFLFSASVDKRSLHSHHMLYHLIAYCLASASFLSQLYSAWSRLEDLEEWNCARHIALLVGRKQSWRKFAFKVRNCSVLMYLFTRILVFQTYPCFWPADEGEHAMEKYGGYSVEMISEQMDGDIFSKRLALTSQEVSFVFCE